MRTNSLDAAAFRCLTEYRVLVEILYKLDDDDEDDYFLTHFQTTSQASSLSALSVIHADAVAAIKKKIDALVALQKEKMKATIVLGH